MLLSLGAPALTDVARGHEDAVAPVLRGHHPGGGLEPRPRAVGMPLAVLHRLGLGAAADLFADAVHQPFEVVGMDVLLAGGPDHLARRVPEHGLGVG